MSVNKATILGNLGADPEVRKLDNGTKVVTFNVATSERWNDKNTGEKKEKTEWHRVVIFGQSENDGLAGVAEKYLKKGSKVYLEGKIQTRKWEKDGVDHYTTEIVLSGFQANLTLLDSAGSNRPPAASSPDEYGQTRTRDESGQGRPQASQPPAFEGGMDDDIPF